MNCPICDSEEIVESRSRGLKKILLSFSPLTRFRCRNCWYRFWAFRTPMLKVTYLTVLSVLVLAAGFQVYLIWTGKSFSIRQPAGNTGAVAEPAPDPERTAEQPAPPKEAAAIEAGPVTAEERLQPGEGAPAREQTIPTESEGLALRELPDEDASVVYVLESGDPYGVVHRQDDWAVIELSGGALGWARQDDLGSWSAAEVEPRPEKRQRPRMPPGPGPGREPQPKSVAVVSPPIEGGAGPVDPLEIPEDMMTVGVDIGNVREAPSLKAPILFRVMENETVRMVEAKGDWLRIRHPSGMKGWAHRDLFDRRSKTTAFPEKTTDEGGAEAPRLIAVDGKQSLPVVEIAQAEDEGPDTKNAVAQAQAEEKPPAPKTVSAGEDMPPAPAVDAQTPLLEDNAGGRIRIVDPKGDWLQLASGGYVHQSLREPKKAGSEPGGQPPDAAAEKRPEKKADAEEPVRTPRVDLAAEMLTVGVELGLVRTAPSADSPVRFRIYGQEAVAPIERRGEWIQVRRVNGWTGWAHESLFLPPAAATRRGDADAPEEGGPTAVVGVDVGMVREAPSASAPRAFRVVEKMSVRVLERQGDWIRIRLKNGWSGWAHRSLFAEVKGEGGKERQPSEKR